MNNNLIKVALLGIAAPFMTLGVASTTTSIWQCGNVECVTGSKTTDATPRELQPIAQAWDCKGRPCTDLSAETIVPVDSLS
ncbi:hypothetical protein [Deinococcus enclensis]|uniref:Secreted protein n=1 Tax=Deinococcus enclensis TaxID=1049582 RepID=A0ABT9MHS4_9DEIO|nr:hypothetical protein [Deinococcus enclensis]MDP9766145.1 hypothetical protein [Deinococcus enclensis]